MHPIKIAESFSGVPYKLGSDSINVGVDCFSYILLYMENNGVKVPNEWRGFNRDKCGDQYKELFIKDPDRAKKLMVEFVSEFTDDVPINDAMPGDVLLLELRGCKGRNFLGVMTGGGNFYSVIESQGVMMTSLKPYVIKKVFRCHKQ